MKNIQYNNSNELNSDFNSGTFYRYANIGGTRPETPVNETHNRGGG